MKQKKVSRMIFQTVGKNRMLAIGIFVTVCGAVLEIGRAHV